MARTLNILLVDNNAELRARMAEFVATELTALGDLRVGEASDGPGALAQFDETAWDIVVLDVALPGESGLQVLPRLMAKRPQVRVVMCSSHVDPPLIQASFQRGALAYVVKEDAPDELAAAIESVLRGQIYRSTRAAEPGVSAGWLSPANAPDGRRRPVRPVTEDEAKAALARAALTIHTAQAVLAQSHRIVAAVVARREAVQRRIKPADNVLM